MLYSLNYGFIDEARFQRRFGIAMSESYPCELDFAVSSGLLIKTEERWQLASGRFDAMHIIRSLFYPEAAKDWLIRL